MSSKIPFEFDISVSADKKRRAKNKGSSGAFENSSRQCDVEGCELIGKYRAPKSPKNVDEFNWFCLKHVKEYNRKWNFFEGHSQQDLENQFKADSVWERKTSPLNSDVNKDKIQAEGKAWARLGLEDPYDLFSNKENPHITQRKLFSRRLPASERKALDILGASDTTTKSELRKVYKEMVKDLHPDRNSGSRADEDRLSEVVWAWEQIKSSKSFKD